MSFPFFVHMETPGPRRGREHRQHRSSATLDGQDNTTKQVADLEGDDRGSATTA
jgi:hypothetical protein